jgi:hypothetical protein
MCTECPCSLCVENVHVAGGGPWEEGNPGGNISGGPAPCAAGGNSFFGLTLKRKKLSIFLCAQVLVLVIEAGKEQVAKG